MPFLEIFATVLFPCFQCYRENSENKTAAKIARFKVPHWKSLLKLKSFTISPAWFQIRTGTVNNYAAISKLMYVTESGNCSKVMGDIGPIKNCPTIPTLSKIVCVDWFWIFKLETNRDGQMWCHFLLHYHDIDKRKWSFWVEQQSLSQSLPYKICTLSVRQHSLSQTFPLKKCSLGVENFSLPHSLQLQHIEFNIHKLNMWRGLLYK